MAYELSKEELKKALTAHYKLSIEQHDPYYQLFVKLGADPNINGNIGIKEKVRERDLEAVKFLHSYGADLSPGLEIAIQEGLLDFAQYFLENGVTLEGWRVEPAIKRKDIPMLQLLCKYHIEIPDRLKKAIKEMGIKEKVLERDLEAVRFLHSYGADLSPGLEVAIKEGLIDFAEYFLENGATLEGWQVEPAIKRKDIPMLQLLCEYHVEIPDRLKPAVKELGIDWDKEIA